MNLTERFAQALAAARERSGLSQEELAARSDLDRTFISQLERAQKSPTLTTIEKLAGSLQVSPHQLLLPRVATSAPVFPGRYLVRSDAVVRFSRSATAVTVPIECIFKGVTVAHELIDQLYAADLDIAPLLGMRNLSAFIGELVAAGIQRCSDGYLVRNPHQDGYPDLLVMDAVGRAAWNALAGSIGDKAPFSPFVTGGIEIKATCGSVPTPARQRAMASSPIAMGTTRGPFLSSYDWKAHHRETNNLLGVFWDFLDRRPRVVAGFYSDKLTPDHWGAIVAPHAGGGRTTSVSIMNRIGIRQMYEGWLFVLKDGPYARFFDARNRGSYLQGAG